MKARDYFIVALWACLSLPLCVGDATAAPTTITYCRTISLPGSYVLGRNLTVPATSATGNCLVVAADNVTIDLNGFSIIGKGDVGTAIRTTDAYHNLVVRNGTIMNFDTGVYNGGYINTVERMHFTNNSNMAVWLASGDVKDCTFYENGRTILVVGDGIVSGNKAMYNLYGISCGFACVVTGNTSSNNSFYGIDAWRGSTVSNNSASDNMGDGLSVHCPANVFNNTLIGNDTNLHLIDEGCITSNNLAP